MEPNRCVREGIYCCAWGASKECKRRKRDEGQTEWRRIFLFCKVPYISLLQSYQLITLFEYLYPHVNLAHGIQPTLTCISSFGPFWPNHTPIWLASPDGWRFFLASAPVVFFVGVWTADRRPQTQLGREHRQVAQGRRQGQGPAKERAAPCKELGTATEGAEGVREGEQEEARTRLSMPSSQAALCDAEERA